MGDNFFRGFKTNDIKEAKTIFVGIPYDGGCSCGMGCKEAPKIIRMLSAYLPPYSMNKTSLEDFKLYDYGDLIYDDIYQEFSNILEYDKFNFVIGGDHSISIPTQKAFFTYAKKLNKIPVVIHIDAHLDICDVYDDSYYSHACVNRRGLENGLDLNNLIMIGIRSYEKEEILFLNDNKEIKIFDSYYIIKNGYSEIINYLKNKYNYDNHMIYLSYDIDALDPSYAPGTGTPEAFGLDSFLLLEFIKELFHSLNIKVMDIVEVSPPLDCNNITSWLVLKTIYEVIRVLIKRGNFL